jgi:hypothetical protein
MDQPPHVPLCVIRAMELRRLGLPFVWLTSPPDCMSIKVTPSNHGVRYFLPANLDHYE